MPAITNRISIRITTSTIVSQRLKLYSLQSSSSSFVELLSFSAKTISELGLFSSSTIMSVVLLFSGVEGWVSFDGFTYSSSAAGVSLFVVLLSLLPLLSV